MKRLIQYLLFLVAVVAVLVHLLGGWNYSNVLIADAFEVGEVDAFEVPVEQGIEVVGYSTPLGEMDAWYLPATGTTWVIHVHGKGGSPDEALPLFGPLREAGYPQLAITYRNDPGQPLDPSGYYQYGFTEWQDIESALDYAVANGADEIVLSGFGSGAAHVLSLVYHVSLDRISGLILDSPNLDFSSTVDYTLAQRELPLVPLQVPRTVSEVAKFFTSMRIGVNWKSLDYIDNAGRSFSHPVLIHHGTADARIPIATSRELAAIRPDLVRLVEVEGAGHVESYDVDRDGYVAAVLGFLGSIGR